MTTHQIRDAGDLRKYFTQVPNSVDDAGLSLIAFRLYVHLKRVAGDNGHSYQSGETLAAACNMSTGAVSKAKEELEAAGLIKIEIRKDQTHQWHDITIIDIWGKNLSQYSVSHSEDSLSPDEEPPSPSEIPPSPDETKNNSLIKNNPIKNNYTYSEIFSKLDSMIGCVTGGNSDVETAEIMLDEFGVERFKKAAAWAKEKGFTNMRTALRSMNTALRNGGFTDAKKEEPAPPPKKTKVIEHRIDGELFIERVAE